MTYELTLTTTDYPGVYSLDHPPTEYEKTIDVANTAVPFHKRPQAKVHQNAGHTMTFSASGPLPTKGGVGFGPDSGITEFHELQRRAVAGNEVSVGFDPFFTGTGTLEDAQFSAERGGGGYDLGVSVNTESTDASAFPAHETVGGYYDFDGVDDYISAPAATMPTSFYPLTFTAWVRANWSTVGNQYRFIGVNLQTAGSYCYISDANYLRMFLREDPTGVSANAYPDANPPENEWLFVHYAITHNAGVSTLEAGNHGTWLRSSSATLTPSPPVYLHLGRLYGAFYDGEIDDARVYNRRLSEAELQRVMNGEVLGDERARYSFNDGPGPMARDTSGNDYHATVYGPSWERNPDPLRPDEFGFADFRFGYDPDSVQVNYASQSSSTSPMGKATRTEDTQGVAAEVTLSGRTDGEGQATLWTLAKSNRLGMLRASFQTGFALITSLSVKRHAETPDYLTGLYEYDLQFVVVSDIPAGLGDMVDADVDDQVATGVDTPMDGDLLVLGEAAEGGD